MTAFAQQDSIYIWNKWCSRKDSLLLFETGNNVIQVWGKGLKPADIKLKSLDNALRIGTPEVKGDTISVMAMPYPEKSKKMRLAILNAKTGKPIKTVEFTSDKIPRLVAWLGKIGGGEAMRQSILGQSMLRAVFPGSLYSYPYTIKQYTFRIHYDKGGITVNSNSFFVTQDVMQQVGLAPAGTVMEFINIKATCPDCASRSLDDLKIKIR